MNITTEVYCKFSSSEDREFFTKVLESFPTPPNDSHYDQTKLIELFGKLGVDISEVKYHFDPEWSIYNIDTRSDTEVFFVFEENNDFSWDEMLTSLNKAGCDEVLIKSSTDNGDVFMGLDNKNKPLLLYMMGQDPKIDELFVSDGCYESGSITTYMGLLRNNEIPLDPSEKAKITPRAGLIDTLSRFFRG